jgi:hypothetical protein
MELFLSLTKAQRSVMDTLLRGDLKASMVKPATLGALATKGLVSVNDGMVKCSCPFTYELFRAGMTQVN